ncbi:MAG: DUF4838 domain-containing protein [Clostridia bacterium]|nr:DUF4838 domain-containing protein [Clostridia bacterium]
MKRCISVFMVVLLTILAAQSALCASAAASPEIVLPENPAPWQTNASSVLREYLAKTGAENTARIRFHLDDPAVQPPSGKDGAYRIAEREGDVYISGSGKRGTLYGVFAFLEEICGCRWYAHDLEVIPHCDAITVPDGYETQYTPFFEYCETDWRTSQSIAFATANRMNGSAYRSAVPDAWGGSVNYLSGFAHTLTTQFCAARSYFDTHPEYFALHEGQRTPNQLCLTNPDTLRIVTGEVLSLLGEKYNPDEATQIVSLTQHDNHDFCTCDACAALDKANGSHAGTMITFANAVADAVRDAGYTNVAIDTFAYEYTRKPPTQVVPRDNVIVRLCSIECCFGHTLDDPACRDNTAFMQDLRDWSAICKRIYIWDYGTNYGESFNFFPNIAVLQRNMQIYYEHNVRGVYGEGNYYLDRCDGEFGALRGYLQCRLMADPYLDYDDTMNGFLAAYYGGGWQSIRSFIDLCCEKGVTKLSHAHIFQRARGSLPAMTIRDVQTCDALWDEAAAKAETQEQVQRVLRSQICWRYWKASNGRREFSFFRNPLRRMQARDALYRDIVAFGNDCIGEMTRKRDLSGCPALHLLRIPFCWSTLYDSPFWDAVSPLVEKLYNAYCARHPA